MEQVTLHIKSNRQVIPSIYEMRLEGDVKAIKQPGQFVNITLEGLYLKRPISISDYDDKGITLLYKTVGKGTFQMAEMKEGENLQILNALGNGFNTNTTYQKVMLAGGGIGVAPLYKLSKELKSQGKDVTVILCFNTSKEVFYTEEFEKLGVTVLVATVDGSMGTKGFVTDAIKNNNLDFEYFYACGPMPMLKALSLQVEQPGEISLEARMGCGFGICMGCSIQTSKGYKRVCKEGPVFRKEEILW